MMFSILAVMTCLYVFSFECNLAHYLRNYKISTGHYNCAISVVNYLPLTANTVFRQTAAFIFQLGNKCVLKI